MSVSDRPTAHEDVERERSRSRPPGSAFTVREALRQHTHAHHVRLNRHPRPQQLVAADLPLAAYCDLLAVYHGYYAAIEPAIELCLTASGAAFDYAPRRKLPWLIEDLGCLAIAPRAARLPPAVQLLTRLANLGEAIGVLYAIEGSTLGGQVIGRHLGRSLQIGAGNGGRFFAGYGKDTENRWQQFCQFAESIAGSPADLQAALRGAERAFTAMEQCFDADD